MNDAQKVLSSPALLSSCSLMPVSPFIESIHLLDELASSFLATFYFSQHYCLFQGTRPSHDVLQEKASVLSLLLSTTFQVSFALGPTCSSFWRPTVSTELCSNALFHMNPLFPISLLHCTTFASMCSNRENKGVNDLSLGL